jgi:hypothetical protein
MRMRRSGESNPKAPFGAFFRSQRRLSTSRVNSSDHSFTHTNFQTPFRLGGRRAIRFPRTEPQNHRDFLLRPLTPLPSQEDQAHGTEGAAGAIHAPLGLWPRELPEGSHFITDLEAGLLGCTDDLPVSISDELEADFTPIVKQPESGFLHNILRFT